MKKLVEEFNTFFRSINLTEMGRQKKEMKSLFQPLRDTIEEHIWKIFAYHNERPQDLNGWIKSLNKHLKKLRNYNVQKENPKKHKFSKKYLYDKLSYEPFQSEVDIDILIGNWGDEGFPIVHVPNERIKDLQRLAKNYVDCIFQKSGKFKPDRKLLL